MHPGTEVSWQDCQEITAELMSRLLPMDEASIAALNGQNGIYIITYEGSDLGPRLFGGGGPQVVYVGISKFNSSRHFTSGNTGTSTMRRSLTALLQTKLDLVPVPRSDDPEDGDRYDNYALESASEEKLTAWMLENFKSAFYQAPRDMIDALERAMVNYNAPLFNFQHNPGNKYGAQLKKYRQLCADQARKNEKSR